MKKTILENLMQGVINEFLVDAFNKAKYIEYEQKNQGG